MTSIETDGAEYAVTWQGTTYRFTDGDAFTAWQSATPEGAAWAEEWDRGVAWMAEAFERTRYARPPARF